MPTESDFIVSRPISFESIRQLREEWERHYIGTFEPSIYEMKVLTEPFPEYEMKVLTEPFPEAEARFGLEDLETLWIRERVRREMMFGFDWNNIGRSIVETKLPIKAKWRKRDGGPRRY